MNGSKPMLKWVSRHEGLQGACANASPFPPAAAGKPLPQRDAKETAGN
jgi:hypothetical protein